MNTANHVFEYPLSAGVKGEAVVQQFGITMSEEETMPVEQDDLAEQLAMEKERLDKLYVAYQALQSEFDDSKAHIEVLEKEAIDKEIENYAYLTVKDKLLNNVIFEGWMFSSSPSLSSLEHPINDIWLLNCINKKAK